MKHGDELIQGTIVYGPRKIGYYDIVDGQMVFRNIDGKIAI